VQADVSNADDVDRLVTNAVETLGKVDILFTNAGVFHMASIEDHSPDIWLQTLSVNLTGQFLTCQRVVPEMKKLGKGKIVNNGSIFGHQGVMGCVAYGVSKMGVHGMTRCLAAELASHKINVNAVAPGNVMTAMSDDFYLALGNGDMEAGKLEAVKAYPLGRLGQPDDIANAVVYFASDAADFITGQILFVDGGYSVP
jgi:3-oxoacyl-[acyl-carrier protein] reductase